MPDDVPTPPPPPRPPTDWTKVALAAFAYLTLVTQINCNHEKTTERQEANGKEIKETAAKVDETAVKVDAAASTAAEVKKDLRVAKESTERKMAETAEKTVAEVKAAMPKK